MPYAEFFNSDRFGDGEWHGMMAIGSHCCIALRTMVHVGVNHDMLMYCCVTLFFFAVHLHLQCLQFMFLFEQSLKQPKRPVKSLQCIIYNLMILPFEMHQCRRQPPNKQI